MISNTPYWCESKVNRLWLLIITQTETHVIQCHLKLNSRVILRRNLSLKPLVLKILITLYRLGTSDVLRQHLWLCVPSWGGYQTWPLIWRTVVWPCLTQDSEHGFNFTAVPWIQCHSDEVVTAVPPELDEPPPSKKGYVKTKNLLSGDLTVSLVLSSLPAPSPSLKLFLKTYEAVPNAPGDCPNSPLEMPLESGLPHPENPLCAAGMSQPAHLHSSSWPLGNDTQHLTCAPGAMGEANVVAVQFLFCTVTHSLIPTQPWDRGQGPCCDTHEPVSPTKPLLSPSHTFALDLSLGLASAHPRATVAQHLQGLPSPLVLNSQALLSYFCYSVCTGNAEQTWSPRYSKHKNWLCL